MDGWCAGAAGVCMYVGAQATVLYLRALQVRMSSRGFGEMGRFSVMFLHWELARERRMLCGVVPGCMYVCS
ncbi:hypothetical protein K505DRAFT_330221 [Melanomma pulvis-pyrius CBS 109.77]|uniref:Uncharacterized protein n=1 Tax=Melanomma pulvis-pyrius CBS 109.77 TaxID=1314802 RepID=A0A6A6WRB6_9PLEO|nr:hypothetical protein K505DRAFT_330221 [Melanomma pulvis-pyrius CBS 109.77]